jgi:riboflavin biosynthesis pyrimidine reductase
LTLVRLFPSFEVFEGLSRDEQSWVIAKDYGICNGWRVNFAIDSSGRSYGETGVSADVSTELDRLLLGKLRSLSDVIVTSGLTARTERYRSSKHAPIAIFTASGDLDDVPAIQGTQYFTPLVLTPQSKAAEVEIRLSDVDVLIIPFEHTNGESGWPSAVSAAIHHEGFQSPILESGLSTLSCFLQNNVVNEVCLSITNPQATGVSARDLDPAYISDLFGGLKGFELRQLFTDGKATFSRWRRGSTVSQP